MQIKQKRWIRTVWTMLFYLLCGAILFLYGYGYWKNSRFLLIGIVLLLVDSMGILLISLFEARHHNLSRGMKYACLHNKMEKALIQGFIRAERFSSLNEEGKLLSMNIWTDEAAVERWRNVMQHRMSQKEGREKLFESYKITVCSEIRSYTDKDRSQAPQDSNAFFEV